MFHDQAALNDGDIVSDIEPFLRALDVELGV